MQQIGELSLLLDDLSPSIARSQHRQNPVLARIPNRAALRENGRVLRQRCHFLHVVVQSLQNGPQSQLPVVIHSVFLVDSWHRRNELHRNVLKENSAESVEDALFRHAALPKERNQLRSELQVEFLGRYARRILRRVEKVLWLRSTLWKYLHPDALRPHRPVLRREIRRGNHDAQTIREAKQKQLRVETTAQIALGEGRRDDKDFAFVERNALPIRNFRIEVSGEGNLC